MTFETLEELIAYQRAVDLVHIHLVCMKDNAFIMAHTDPERLTGTPLEGCRAHRTIAAEDEQPVPDGTYTVSEGVRPGDWDGWGAPPEGHWIGNYHLMPL